MKKPIIDFIKNIIRTLFISLGVLLIILLVSLFGPREIYYFERGIYYGYNLILEYKFSKVIDKVKQTRSFKPIPLQYFSKNKVVRACVQPPYITQAYFEEWVGEKVSNFNETSDHDGDILWLFFSDGSISRVRIFMNFWNNGMTYCTKKTPVISFKSDESYPAYINFYFNKED